MLEKFLNVELVDSDSSNGGIAFVGETLFDFMEELDLDFETTTLDQINNLLDRCGIEPLVDEDYWMCMGCQGSFLQGDLNDNLCSACALGQDEPLPSLYDDLGVSYKELETLQEIVKEIDNETHDEYSGYFINDLSQELDEIVFDYDDYFVNGVELYCFRLH